MVTLPFISLDSVPIAFGKYKGMTPDDISEVDPRYIMWLYENIEPKRVSKDLYMVCESGADSGADEGDRWSIY